MWFEEVFTEDLALFYVMRRASVWASTAAWLGMGEARCGAAKVGEVAL
jgi:hypothetical protein